MAWRIRVIEEERGLLADWDLSKSMVNTSGTSSSPEYTVRASHFGQLKAHILLGNLAIHGYSAHWARKIRLTKSYG